MYVIYADTARYGRLYLQYDGDRVGWTTRDQATRFPRSEALENSRCYPNRFMERMEEAA